VKVLSLDFMIFSFMSFEDCALRNDWKITKDKQIVMDVEVARKYDLTSKMAPYLDVHMISPLLDFFREVLL
jgi:hypothetical protein